MYGRVVTLKQKVSKWLVSRILMSTVGLLIFKDKKFQGFCGQLLNRENKHPLNFYTSFHRNWSFFVVDVVALWKYYNREVKTPLPSSTGSLSIEISTDGIVAANKEVQWRVMDSLMMGHCLRVAHMNTLTMKRGHKLIIHLEKIVATCYAC